MQPFRFRLQRILDWQAKVCQAEEEKLRLCLAELARSEQVLAQLAAQTVTVEREFLAQADFAPLDLKALAEFRRRTTLDRVRLLNEQGKVKQALAAQREKWLAERRRLEILDKLRERAKAAYTAALDKELETLALESYLTRLVTRRSSKSRE